MHETWEGSIRACLKYIFVFARKYTTSKIDIRIHSVSFRQFLFIGESFFTIFSSAWAIQFLMEVQIK